MNNRPVWNEYCKVWTFCCCCMRYEFISLHSHLSPWICSIHLIIIFNLREMQKPNRFLSCCECAYKNVFEESDKWNWYDNDFNLLIQWQRYVWNMLFFFFFFFQNKWIELLVQVDEWLQGTISCFCCIPITLDLQDTCIKLFRSNTSKNFLFINYISMKILET